MTVEDLIRELQKVNPAARVHMGYDGNIVGTRPDSVEEIVTERQIGNCWYSVNIGDVVILADK